MDVDKKTEWRMRGKWTLLVLLVFILMAIIGSVYYRFTGGTYNAQDLYRDLGFYDANANVNAATPTNVNSGVNANAVNQNAN